MGADWRSLPKLKMMLVENLASMRVVMVEIQTNGAGEEAQELKAHGKGQRQAKEAEGPKLQL